MGAVHAVSQFKLKKKDRQTNKQKTKVFQWPPHYGFPNLDKMSPESVAFLTITLFKWHLMLDNVLNFSLFLPVWILGKYGHWKCQFYK